MTRERWHQIEGVYHAVADLDLRERVRFLDRACATDPDLRRDIDGLLAAEVDADRVIETAIRSEAEELAAKSSELIVGKRIGAYRITAVIGAGGMGAIYRAARDDDQYQKEVAIKVVKRGMDLDAIGCRFWRERQILARLEHPNIARLIDGGTTEDGRPYFVMEYVDGQPLTEYCASLALKDRLRLFRQVCAVVEYAHQNRIVHRDLKPANILITKEGLPKLLDFGLAQVFSTDEPPDKSYSFVRMLTPDYASPEQVRGGAVTPTSDVYSLGAILYELASGRRAHQLRNRTPAEMERVICEQDPAPLGGELGGIARMAMHKQPEHRYQSVKQLSEDVRRYLESLPVLARKASLSYKAGKFVRRNRLAVALSTIALLSLVTGISVAISTRRGPAALQVRPITALPGSEEWPDLSPDGTKVVFTWRGGNGREPNLYLVAVDAGSEPVRLTNSPTYDWSPAWSPDGRQIAFRRGRSIYLISPLARTERKLADDPQASSHLSWSPDGKWIATARYPAAYSKPAVVSEMAVISTESGERKVLSRHDPPAFNDAPVFSADGKRLAYMACGNGSNCTVAIQRISRESELTGEPLRLPAPGEMHSRLAWSPDQQWIVYSRVGTGDTQGLWRVWANGGRAAERLPLAGERFTSPSFARTGKGLLVAQEHLDIDILSFALNGGFPPTSTAPPRRWAWSTRYEQRPDYSPDGAKVVFVSTRSGSSDIWMANADGSNAIRLTDHFGSANGSPKWSRDGRWIAFTSVRDGNSDIWLMDADGGQRRRLTQWPTTEAEPSWSRDGRSIYFRSDCTGRPEVWKMRLGGGDPRQITTAGGWVARESADGALLYYTKQPSSPLFGRPLAGGEEQQVLEWIEQRSFVVTQDGIYYVGRRDPQNDASPLSFHDFRSGRDWLIRRVGATSAMELAISPDHRTMLLPVFDPPDGNPSSDLMLIENFH